MSGRFAAALLRSATRRNFSTTVKRRSGHDNSEFKTGYEFPFDINNRWKLGFHFTWFWGSALGFPFLCTYLVLMEEQEAAAE